jgi:hypothetical protein
MVKSGGLQPVLQAAISNGLSLDPFSIGQDGWAASEVNVGRGELPSSTQPICLIGADAGHQE